MHCQYLVSVQAEDTLAMQVLFLFAYQQAFSDKAGLLQEAGQIEGVACHIHDS